MLKKYIETTCISNIYFYFEKKKLTRCKSHDKWLLSQL
jgi:hypothetical protein